MWFLLAIVGLATILANTSFMIPKTSSTGKSNIATTSACYALDESKQLKINPNWLIRDECKSIVARRTYVLIRPNVRIVNAKIAEGKSVHLQNDCKESFYGSLRKIGNLPTGEDIFWENENHKKKDLKDFLLVKIKADTKYHYFDVYIDQRKKDNLPDFILNCKEIGGLIPVLEGPTANTFPPQFIKILPPNEEIDHTNPKFNTNFNELKQFFKEYFVRLDENPLPHPTPGQNPPQIGIFTKTIETQTKTYDVFFHAGIMYLKDQTDQKTYRYNPTDDAPDYESIQNKTLKLQAQKFVSTAQWTWATPECKPALYLYPPHPLNLNIKIQPKGKLTFSKPLHGNSGWKIKAYPSGKIELPDSNTPLIYPYLYYESEINNFIPPDTGWIVKKEDLTRLLNKILPALGLNTNESLEFKKYWIKILNKTKHDYYFVGLVPRKTIDNVEPIYFSIHPDTFIRVRLFFEPLNDPFKVIPPVLPKPPFRKGFTAVDWGGFLAQGTCSKAKSF